jgi:TolB-like protein
VTDPVPQGEDDSTWSRLRRRKVVQWGIAYSAVAWGFLQGLEYVSDAFGWPAQLRQLAIVALLVGLPVVVVVAWYHGDRGAQRVTATELVIVTLLCLAGGALFWRFERRLPQPSAEAPQSRTAEASDPHSIAVLPFVDMSQAQDQAYFADGISEELLNLLTQVPGLRVIARASSFTFKGKDADVATVAAALHVANVLEGSVRKSGDTLRVTAQLVRASDSTQLWSQAYDRRLTDLFKVQDEIAAAVVAALRVRLLPGNRISNAYRTASSEAHDQYLIGNEYYNRSDWDGYRRALAAYRQAIALDPAYAPAYAQLANAEFYVAEISDTAAENAAGKARALEAAEKAISLAPELADGYAARGWLRTSQLWDWEGATADVKKALDLESGNSVARMEYGRLLAAQGRLPEAIAEARRAIDLDPLSAHNWSSLGWLYLCTQQWSAAHGALERALIISPDSTHANYYSGVLELLQGRASASEARFSRAGPVFGLTGRAFAQHSLGHHEESARLLGELVEKYAQDAAYQIAEEYAWRGQDDEAFVWLERAYDAQDGGMVYIRTDPFLKSLHSDARFTAMLQKLGLAP